MGGGMGQFLNYPQENIYLVGSPSGAWSYGNSEKNPYCPTLFYSYLKGKEGELGHLMSEELKETYKNMYKFDFKILPDNFEENDEQYLKQYLEEIKESASLDDIDLIPKILPDNFIEIK